jgi:hypothetical protein
MIYFLIIKFHIRLINNKYIEVNAHNKIVFEELNNSLSIISRLSCLKHPAFQVEIKITTKG